MIFNLRGTNGSGKTWVVEQLMEQFGNQPVDNGHYVPKLNLYIAGEYGKRACGGCDGIKGGASVVMGIVDHFALAGHVLFEGVILSTVFQSWLDWGQGRMVWMFLDTPLSVCLARVRARSSRQSFKSHKVVTKYISIARIQSKARFHDQATETIRHQYALPDLVAVLRKYGV